MNAFGPVLMFCFVLAAIVTAMVSFDHLIRWLYTKKNEEWMALGRPTGYLFRPEEAKFWRSDYAKTEFAYRWFFRPPAWIFASEELRRALRIYRGSRVCAIIGIVALVFTLLR